MRRFVPSTVARIMSVLLGKFQNFRNWGWGELQPLLPPSAGTPMLTNKTSTVLCSVVKHAGSGTVQHERSVGETRDVVECFSLSDSSTASQVLYNRTEHSRGFFICLMIKNPFISPRIRLILLVSI